MREMDARIIYGIVVLVVLLVICFIHWRITDSGDFGEFFIDDFGWITVLAVLLIGGIGYGVAFWNWNLKIVLAVGIPVVVLLIACVIHWHVTDCVDLEDFFVYEYGWVTILAVCLVSGVVLGCIFWIWWAVLLIAAALCVLGGIGLFAHIKYNRQEDNFEETDFSEDDMTEKIKRNYKCPNCGAQIFEEKKTALANRAVRFYCTHCGTYFTERELKGFVDDDSKLEYSEDIDLTDFEEDYFEACYRLNFRPYNAHSKRQLERRYETIQNQIWEHDFVYDDDEDGSESEEILDGAYEFFKEESAAIEQYLNDRTETEIKARYEYFLENYIEDGDEDDKE